MLMLSIKLKVYIIIYQHEEETVLPRKLLFDKCKGEGGKRKRTKDIVCDDINNNRKNCESKILKQNPRRK